MLDIIYVDQYMEPADEQQFDLVGYVEEVLGHQIRRIKISDIDSLCGKLWNPNRVVWFSKLLSKEVWERITEKTSPENINVVFASTRLGIPVIDHTVEQLPDFIPEIENYCLEYSSNLEMASYDIWGIRPSCVIPNPLFNWDFYHDDEVKMQLRTELIRKALGREEDPIKTKLALVSINQLSFQDVFNYGQYFPNDGSWAVLYYVPFCQSGKIKQVYGGEQVGIDFPYYNALMVSDAIITNSFYGPEYFITSLNPQRTTILAPGIYFIESMSEISASYFKSMIKFFSKSVVQLEIDFLERESVYVQYSKINSLIGSFTDPLRESFNYVKCSPTAATQKEALDVFTSKFNVILRRIKEKHVK